MNAVRLNGECGRWFATENGVKQGDNLSPSLFSVYINDLLIELQSSGIEVKLMNVKLNVLAYADDLVLIAPIQVGLQQLLNITKKWCKKNRLKVNTDKTKIMHVRPAGIKETTYRYMYNDAEIEKVENYKYLGGLI